MILEPTIQRLFPSPVYMNKINREFTPQELEFVNKKIDDCKTNVGNIHTNDNYIFKSDALNKIEEFVSQCVDDYFKKIVSTKNPVKPYITQSWLNYTKQEQFHHQHTHPNSYISGCIYINADRDTDKITFWRKVLSTIQLENNEFNSFNSAAWKFSVGTGDIVLFPSELAHSVEPKEGSNTRTSLAFNVFLKGTIGSAIDLFELELA